MTFNLLYCRFCAEQKPTPEIIDLTTEITTLNDIKEKLSSLSINCIDFSIKTLPETICMCCYNSLNSSHQFITKIKASQTHLQDIQTKYKFDDFDENYEESNSPVKLESTLECENDLSTPENYSCTLVEAKFEAQNDVSNVTWSSYSYTCTFCKEKLHSLESVRDHCKAVHGKCFGVICADCDCDLDNFDMFVEHVRLHRNDLNHYCPHCNLKQEDTHAHTQPHCETCGEMFTTEKSLYTHINKFKSQKISKREVNTFQELLSYGVEIYQNDIKISNWKEYPWICLYCCMKFPNQNILNSHVKEVHNKCFGLKCVDCVKIVNSFSEFVEHVRSHRPSLQYSCQYCDYKCGDANETIVHIKQHTTQPQCDNCGEFFQNLTDLQKHITVFNPPKSKRVPFKRRERPITVEDLTCEICKKVMKSSSNLRAHKTLHMARNRDYTCDRCGRAFFTKGALSTHKIIHENPDPQICRICKKSFLTLTRLKKHVKTHNGVKPYQCSECHRCFRLKEHLKGHMITHTNLMPYQCQYCEKSFKHKNVLKNHENQHTGARPYSCDVCNMDFTNWSNCNKHMKRKHGTTLAKNVMTPQGKVPINPKTGKPKKLKDFDTVKEWTEKIMVPSKRGKKTGVDEADLMNDFGDDTSVFDG